MAKQHKLSDIVNRLIEVIKRKKHWTQKVMARNAKGGQTSPTGKYACSFCSLGALDKVVENYEFEKTWRRNAITARFDLLYGSVPFFNDTKTHKEVLAAWRAVRDSFLAEEKKSALQ